MPWTKAIRKLAFDLKADAYALFLASKDPRTPWYAKFFAAAIVAYAFSPIDLIPDFVPVLGYLDDLLLIPLGIALALKLIPDLVMEECRERAKEKMKRDNPVSRAAGALIILIWISLVLLLIGWGYQMVANGQGSQVEIFDVDNLPA
ncbi:MAG: DUF1232 domain-containing protein [Desulfobacteraceae bacterium]|jgi:uncharacterized membrane protein YkvA (DUF1232 family)|nr:MAG: DUF1232 domain-containing protein [Desulfobacteraceae bacterium]